MKMGKGSIGVILGVSLVGSAACSNDEGSGASADAGASADGGLTTTLSAGDGDGDGDGGDATAGTGDGDGDADGGTGTPPKFDIFSPDGGGSDDGGGGPVDESTCEAAAKSLTSAGCSFAPLVLQVGATLPWAVVAANTNNAMATATLYDRNDQVIQSAAIAPGDSHVFELTPSGGNTLSDHIISGATGIYDKALRLESDIPIVAYQFAPYSSSQNATSDASILLPEHAWGDDYLAAAYHNSDNSDSRLTIVSFTDSTDVTVTMPSFMTGATAAGGGVPSLAAGQSGTVTLDRGEVLRVQSPGSGTADLTGARVESTAPVGMFVGAPSMSLPGPGFVPYKDHLEEQLAPRTAWGKEYAVVHFRPRSTEEDLYRFVADKDGTVITLAGGVTDTVNLDAGEFHEVRTTENFLATGTEAFMVAHYMYSQSLTPGPKNDTEYPGNFLSPNCSSPSQATTELGDPAISFFPAVAQYRFNYTFLTPSTYAWDMVTVIAPMNGWNSIQLDGQPLPASPTALGAGSLGFARFLVDDGAHEIRSSSVKFGIEVYGYDCRVSYAYPGGLSLAEINQPPG